MQSQVGKEPEIDCGMWGTETSREASKEESKGSNNEPRRTGKWILILACQKIKIFRCGRGLGF